MGTNYSRLKKHLLGCEQYYLTYDNFGYREHCIEKMLPTQLIYEILLRVENPETLVQSCSLVCRRWSDILSARSFWIVYLRRNCDLDVPFSLRHERVLNFKRIAVLQPFDNNLLLNPSGELGLQDWRVTARGGDDWTVEEPPIGCSVGAAEGITMAFATSYDWCKKHCYINLCRAGIPGKFLDKYRPPITVSEYYTCRFDCGSLYRMRAILLPRSKNLRTLRLFDDPKTATFETPDVNTPSSVEFLRKLDQWSDTKWCRVEYTFTDYPAGVGYVYFEHGGRDTQFWKGHYGTKMARASVVVNIGNGIPKPVK